MTTPKTTLAVHRAEFVAEFDAIEDNLVAAIAELAKLLNSYRLSPAAMIDAQAHALASVRALRKVAESIDPGAKAPSNTRPQSWPASLAAQLAGHRIAITQTLRLVALMPGVNKDAMLSAQQHMATTLAKVEATARTHQPARLG